MHFPSQTSYIHSNINDNINDIKQIGRMLCLAYVLHCFCLDFYIIVCIPLMHI
jgi:hypothetical protein